jgi:hypothetical protein
MLRLRYFNDKINQVMINNCSKLKDTITYLTEDLHKFESQEIL